MEIIGHNYIFVKTGQRGTLLKIDLDDIDYLEGRNHYVAFHCGGNKTLVHTTMKEMEERLPASRFLRVHKSFIVALKGIASIEANGVVLNEGQKRIPVGANYKRTFLKRMKDIVM